jgi:hypothetical protein
MRELPELEEVRAAWLSQPEEAVPVDVERVHSPQTRELFSTTRSEILSSIGAAVFFASVIAWRFAPERGRPVLLGCAGVLVWAAVTLVRFRDSIRQAPQPDDLARTGVEHYRAELLRRRDHLRGFWIWHGPFLLACFVAASILTDRIVPGRIRDALPVFLLLVVWAAIGIKRRLRQAAELEREMNEIRRGSPEDKAR